MTIFSDVYYVIVSNGVPREVTQDWKLAQNSREQWSTKSSEAHIVPVKPIPPEEEDFEDETPTNPQMELPFDLSDVEFGGPDKNPEPA